MLGQINDYGVQYFEAVAESALIDEIISPV